MHTRLPKNASQSQMNTADNKAVNKHNIQITVGWMDMELLWRRWDPHWAFKDGLKLNRLEVLIVVQKIEFNRKGLRLKTKERKNV